MRCVRPAKRGGVQIPPCEHVRSRRRGAFDEARPALLARAHVNACSERHTCMFVVFIPNMIIARSGQPASLHACLLHPRVLLRATDGGRGLVRSNELTSAPAEPDSGAAGTRSGGRRSPVERANERRLGKYRFRAQSRDSSLSFIFLPDFDHLHG